MLSEKEIQQAIKSGCEVTYRMFLNTYVGKVLRLVPGGVWFEGIGGRRGTVHIQGYAQPYELSFAPDASTAAP